MITEAKYSKEIYVEQEPRKFTRSTQSDLHAILQRMDANTTLHPINEARELSLDVEGYTQDGYRFTRQAFSQLAQALCPGLVELMPNLTGMKIADRSHINLTDARSAIRLWNAVVDLRFSSVATRRIMRNEQDKYIEGFLSNQYKLLENTTLFSEASAAVQAHAPQTKFFAAMLIGRWLALWYRAEAPMFRLDIGGESYPFYSGYYFANGESTGTSVKGTLAVFTPWGTCLASFKRHGNRLTHTGKSFDTRLEAMFTKIVSKPVPVANIQAGAYDLSKSLRFEPGWMADKIDQRRAQILKGLDMIGLTSVASKEVLALALAEGRHQGKEQISSSMGRIYATRERLDLLVPLLTVARKVGPARRERFEQAGYELLLKTPSSLF